MLDAIKALARQAGDEILRVYSGETMEVALKADQSPVTEADRRADAVIVNGLQAMNPDIPRLTEESAQEPFEKRKEWERFWLVDPLDGTKEFIKKSGQFTVNIALIEAGKPVLGVVWAPAIELCYWGAQGQGAFKSSGGKTIPIRTRKADPDKLAMVASKDHAGPQVEALKKRFPGCQLKSMGSSLKLCLVAEGDADLYLRDGPTMEWDTGAAQAVVMEAGGVVLKWDGEREGEALRYNKENLLNPQFLVKGDASFPVIL